MVAGKREEPPAGVQLDVFFLLPRNGQDCLDNGVYTIAGR